MLAWSRVNRCHQGARRSPPRADRALRGAAALALGGLLGIATGCGLGKGDLGWIGPDTAVVRCSASASAGAMPPLLDEIPSPLPPTGLFALNLDPEALHQLGFTADTVVCAALEAPSEGDIAAAASTLRKLVHARDELDRTAPKPFACVCERAARLRILGWLPWCVEHPKITSCPEPPDDLGEDAELFDALQRAVAGARLPLIHWRLFGRTDRKGQFEARVSSIVRQHRRGSRVFRKGDLVTAQLNYVLVRELLAQESVIAVVRQDSGRALVVFRELGEDRLVIDHFSYPPLHREIYPMIGELDNRRVEQYLAALEPPEYPVEPDFNPRKGAFISVSHEPLVRVDGALAVARVIGKHPYEVDPNHAVPPLLFERVSWQVPTSSDGERVDARLSFTDTAKVWADKLDDTPITPTFAGFPFDDTAPAYRERPDDPVFLLRGSPTEQVTFAGFHGFAEVAGVVEIFGPNSIRGTTHSWTVRLPSGPLPGGFKTRAGLVPLRERLSRAPHVVEVDLLRDRSGLDVTLRPGR